MASKILSTPIGPLTLVGTEDALTEIRFGDCPGNEPLGDTPALHQAAAELAAYFSGALREFTVRLAPVGTPFQQKVWQALKGIPYGETATYGDIAARVGNPKASRAVGMANNRNPLPIVLPCHRVVGKNGSLVGYGGGLPVKERLLALEQGKKGKE